jgi:hypothetical protein
MWSHEPLLPMKYRWQRHGTFAKGARAGLSVSEPAGTNLGSNKPDLKIEFVCAFEIEFVCVREVCLLKEQRHRPLFVLFGVFYRV